MFYVITGLIINRVTFLHKVSIARPLENDINVLVHIVGTSGYLFCPFFFNRQCYIILEIAIITILLCIRINRDYKITKADNSY